VIIKYNQKLSNMLYDLAKIGT